MKNKTQICLSNINKKLRENLKSYEQIKNNNNKKETGPHDQSTDIFIIQQIEINSY